MTFLVLLCIIAICSILSLICEWHLVCNTYGHANNTAEIAALRADVDTLKAQGIRKNKIGRKDYDSTRKLKRENDKLKSGNDRLKTENDKLRDSLKIGP